MWSAGKISPLINTPANLQAALNLLNRTPSMQIVAGCTAFSPEVGSEFPLENQVLSLQTLEDLKKITPWERFADWGAGLTLNQMKTLGKNLLPPLLEKGIDHLGTWTLRNQATLGGNLCQTPAGDLYPILNLLGAQAEWRNFRGSRWEPAVQWGPSGLKPQPGEILARVRIPKESWDQVVYEKLGTWRSSPQERMTFLLLARVRNNSLSALMLGIWFPTAGLVRNRVLESSLQGRRLPLGRTDWETARDGLEDELPFLLQPLEVFQKRRMEALTHWMLAQLRDD